MSDTPRTDAMLCTAHERSSNYLREMVPADFARQLEREIAVHWAAREETAKHYLAVKAENAALREQLAEARKTSLERDVALVRAGIHAEKYTVRAGQIDPTAIARGIPK